LVFQEPVEFWSLKTLNTGAKFNFNMIQGQKHENFYDGILKLGVEYQSKQNLFDFK
jgi:hypothetical protein